MWDTLGLAANILGAILIGIGQTQLFSIIKIWPEGLDTTVGELTNIVAGRAGDIPALVE